MGKQVSLVVECKSRVSLHSFSKDGGNMANYKLQVTLSLGWNGNDLFIDGELSPPTDRNLRELALVQKFWDGASTKTNHASFSFGDVEFPFIEFDTETGYPADWGDPEVPQQQYVMAYFNIPSRVVSEFLQLLEFEESDFDDDEFIEFEGDFDGLTGINLTLTFNDQNVFPEVTPNISVYRE